LEQVEAASTTFEHTDAQGMTAKGTLAPDEHSLRTVAISAAFAVSPAETKQALHAEPLAETVGHKQVLFVPHVSAAITRLEHCASQAIPVDEGAVEVASAEQLVARYGPMVDASTGKPDAHKHELHSGPLGRSVAQREFDGAEIHFPQRR